MPTRNLQRQELSRSKLELFGECPRCFHDDVARGVKRPSGPAFTLNLAVDELLQRPITAAGEKLLFTGVSVGNPHCVVFRPRGKKWTREELLSLGPALENHPIFQIGRAHV